MFDYIYVYRKFPGGIVIFLVIHMKFKGYIEAPGNYGLQHRFRLTPPSDEACLVQATMDLWGCRWGSPNMQPQTLEDLATSSH